MATEKIAVVSMGGLMLHDAGNFHMEDGHLYVIDEEGENVAVYAPGAWQSVSREPSSDAVLTS